MFSIAALTTAATATAASVTEVANSCGATPAPLAASPDNDPTRALVTEDGRMLVRVYINNGGPYLFLVATGSTKTVISNELATQLAVAAGGHLSELRVAGERFTNVRVTTATAASALPSPRGVSEPVAGLLGQDLLNGRNYLLDFEGRRFLFDANRAVRATLSAIPVPLQTSRSRPMLTGVTWPDGSKMHLKMVLDSAATHALLFDGTGAIGPMAASVSVAPEWPGEEIVRMVRIPSLVLPTAELGDVDAAVTTTLKGSRAEDGLLPANTFRAMYVDADRKRILLNPVQKACAPASVETQLTARQTGVVSVRQR